MRVINVGGGGAGAGGHIDVAIGDPTLAPFTINPEDHTDSYPVNLWHWVFTLSPIYSVGAVDVSAVPPGGGSWVLSDDKYVTLKTTRDEVRFTMAPIMDFDTFDETVAAQWQTFGIGTATLAIGYQGASVNLGWGIFPLTYGTADGIYFEKRGGDPLAKIYAVISDSAAHHVAVDTGETLLPGDSHKFAIRCILDGAVWTAFFYIDDALVYTNNATVLTWWPDTSADQPWEMCYTKPADGFNTYLMLKAPWIILGK